MEGNTELSPFHTILALFETEDDDFGPTPGRYTDFEKGKQGHQNKEGCTSRRCNPLVFFPILLSFCIPFLVFSCYIQGLVAKHYHPILPLVSDTGNYSPEAATFSFTITIIGLLFMVVVIIRYLQIRAIILDPTFMQMLSHFYGNFTAAAESLPPPPPPQDSSQEVTVPAYRLRNSQGNRKLFNQVNQLLFWAGIAIACSCMATGAFRFAETFIWHNSAALGVFMLTPVYMAGNTYLSALWCNAVNSVAVYRYRYWITIATCLLVGAFTATILVLCVLYHDFYLNPMTRLFWSFSSDGFLLHTFNSAAEWLFLLSIAPFAYTFVEDFSRLGFSGMRLTFQFFAVHPKQNRGRTSPPSRGLAGSVSDDVTEKEDFEEVEDDETSKKMRAAESDTEFVPPEINVELETTNNSSAGSRRGSERSIYSISSVDSGSFYTASEGSVEDSDK